ncbi:RNA polymerase sigma-70 factor, ECF subfamily [Filimonas lacunae]|uniref:RNA polymerase sigma-70 factor, ECF subfamily n=1 Tax=Filimonas lacunae TaxID=477680 RepID=A0A173MMT3_9BACT|nr:RNA polymerase sigma-70 factor [Filimonas lacunae]BAV08796.1 RNA polymerase ECF-type sigma factor [Filimonas lacunae]SIS61883.1 RNA polymerase sigma-70 factor, ECF subfamily [Filimonas lacunae]
MKGRESTDSVSAIWSAITMGGDAVAFEKLFHMLYSRLINFCNLYVRQREVSEEIVSDVFVKCWMTREQLQHVNNPEVYLFVAVKNGSLNYLKSFSNYRVTSIDDETQLINSASFPEKELEKKELFVKMNKAIAELPQQCQVIFRLVREDGMSYKEAAEILSISPRTVQTQLFRAMKKLNLVLQGYADYPHSIFRDDAIAGIVIFLLVNFF